MTGALQARLRRPRIIHEVSCTCMTCWRRRWRESRFARLVCLDCPAAITGRTGVRCPSCAEANAIRTVRYRKAGSKRTVIYRCGYCDEPGHNRAGCPQRHEEALQAARRLKEAA